MELAKRIEMGPKPHFGPIGLVYNFFLNKKNKK
jgi:hypothetical protein